MSEVLFQSLQRYASRHGLRLGEKLGSGIHGLVHVAFKHDIIEKAALKVHQSKGSYTKEREAYQRLQRASVRQIQGFNVPQLLGLDDELLVIEMSIVSKPYLLDFAGVSLDRPMEFTEDIWREWTLEKREQFGRRWPVVQNVVSALEAYGIYLTDVSPSNIAWE